MPKKFEEKNCFRISLLLVDVIKIWGTVTSIAVAPHERKRGGGEVCIPPPLS